MYFTSINSAPHSERESHASFFNIRSYITFCYLHPSRHNSPDVFDRWTIDGHLKANPLVAIGRIMGEHDGEKSLTSICSACFSKAFKILEIYNNLTRAENRLRQHLLALTHNGGNLVTLNNKTRILIEWTIKSIH